MNVLVIATEDFYGAGKASSRIHHALGRKGHRSVLLVKNKTNADDPSILQYDELVPETFYSKLSRRIRSFFSRKAPLVTDPDYYFFEDRASSIKTSKLLRKLPFVPDIILFTWISRFFGPRDISNLQKATGAGAIMYPVDMSLYTGGCHYAWECRGFEFDCRNCPAIITEKYKDLSHAYLSEKKKYFIESGIQLIVPTEQLFGEAKRSALFRNQLPLPKVLLPIDPLVFNNQSRDRSKNAFGLNINDKVIFFGASFTQEKRKGIHLFLEAIEELEKRIGNNKALRDQICLLVVGKNHNETILEKLRFRTKFIEYIREDEKLSLLYQAADVFITTSIQDSGPMMVNESLMCGTPVVAFDLGVMPDLVRNGINGFKVPKGDTTAAGEALYNVLSEKIRIDRNEIARTANAQTGFDSFNSSFSKALYDLNHRFQ